MPSITTQLSIHEIYRLRTKSLQWPSFERSMTYFTATKSFLHLVLPYISNCLYMYRYMRNTTGNISEAEVSEAHAAMPHWKPQTVVRGGLASRGWSTCCHMLSSNTCLKMSQLSFEEISTNSKMIVCPTQTYYRSLLKCGAIKRWRTENSAFWLVSFDCFNWLYLGLYIKQTFHVNWTQNIL